MDFRRQVPRTDVVLADPAVAAAAEKLGRPQVKRGRCLLDVRALPAEQDAALQDAALQDAVVACMS